MYIQDIRAQIGIITYTNDPIPITHTDDNSTDNCAY